MSQTKTSADLVKRVASLLGRLVAGEALGDVESTTIDRNIDDVLEEVSNFCYIADRDEIPSRYFYTLAWLVAIHSASDFSSSPLDVAALQQHEARLRYLSAEESSNEPVKSLYY